MIAKKINKKLNKKIISFLELFYLSFEHQFKKGFQMNIEIAKKQKVKTKSFGLSPESIAFVTEQASKNGVSESRFVDQLIKSFIKDGEK